MRYKPAISVRALPDRSSIRFLFVLGAMMVTATLARANWTRFLPLHKPTTKSFVSAGATIHVEHFSSKETGRRPTVILLHGIGGPQSKHNLYKIAATLLVKRGYTVLLVHYFDRTGTKRNDAKLFEEFRQCIQGNNLKKQQCEGIRKKYLAWMDAIKDTIRYARKQPNVDPDRIGLMGFSLGGFLALSVAVQVDVNVQTVVEICGGLPQEMHPLVGNLPPTLVVHGDEDRIVPVEQAKVLAKLGKEQGAPITVEIISGAHHGIVDKHGACDWNGIAKVAKLTLTFLEKHLAQPARVTAGPQSRSSKVAQRKLRLWQKDTNVLRQGRSALPRFAPAE